MASAEELYHTLVAVLALLLVSHLFGYLFSWLRLPPVIGEICGGLVLGPTLLGTLAPNVSQALFAGDPRVPLVLSMAYNFGFMLLMFCSGIAMKNLVGKGQRRLSVTLAIFGTVIPLGFGLLGSQIDAINLQSYLGPAGNPLALALVFAVAIAVTSLPVLSRIFIDLGIMNTRFARICLSASVLDDVILYVVLAIALSLVQDPTSAWGLIPKAVSGLTMPPKLAIVAVSNLAFVLAALTVGRRLLALLELVFLNWLSERNPVAFLLAVMVAVCVLSLLLGIPLVLGAFCAGLIGASSRVANQEQIDRVQRFAFAFFVPLYFAMVGFRLNLHQDFEWLFFTAFLIVASLIKSLSIYAGAAAAGARNPLRINLAIVMNARGGPGIVVASVAFDAAIIDARLYTSLVLLAIVTSLLAGAYLGFRTKRGLALE
jgi:Kef-type K+ transport system membrane component KefB